MTHTLMTNLLFQRPVDQSKYLEYIEYLNSIGDFFSLNKWKKNTLIKIYHKDYEEESIVFRFVLIKDWISQNQRFDWGYINNLEYNLELLNLNSFLNAFENNYLYQTKAYIFSLSRNAKSLIVDFSLNKKEEAYFWYDQISLFYHNSKKEIIYGRIFLTNERIVFTNNTHITFFYLNNITRIWDDSKDIYVIYAEQKYKITFNDIKLLSLSLSKLYKIIGKTNLYEQPL